MPRDPSKVFLYHITSVHNLPSIIAQGYLFSDAIMSAHDHQVSGHLHIKERRLTRIKVPCCDGRFVGDFVPFYYCPRTPMLLQLNAGKVRGRPPGCQNEIVHLVTSVDRMIALGQPWAISDSNAGAYFAEFFNKIDALDTLRWDIIESNDWGGDKIPWKQAEFLVADRVPWSAVRGIGCYNSAAVSTVQEYLGSADTPKVAVKRGWYFP